MLLLMQYFKKGLLVVAKNLKRLLCNINVVMFQLIKKTPQAMPVMKALSMFTEPKYSGAKNKASAPKFCMKLLLMVLPSINQNNNSTWYFLKCRRNN